MTIGPKKQKNKVKNLIFSTIYILSILACYNSLENKTTLNFVNASYLFTHISYLEKTYTITAQEPSIYFYERSTCMVG